MKKLITLGFLLLAVTFGQGCPKENITSTFLNNNNISIRIYNNGQISLADDTTAGMEFPIGSGKYILRQSGFVFGAKVDGEIRVGGSTEISGLSPGRILDDGTAEDPVSESVRVYRVRPDWRTCSLENEIRDEEKTEQQIRYQYERDWYEWPAEHGAPFEDFNGNGIYEPDIDLAGKQGLNQTVWFVANDLNEEKTKSLYGSRSLGIELQVTIGSFRGDDAENNLILRWYKITNKSDYEFDDMYLSYWMDPDIGNKEDDYIGCDSVLNMAFAYNSNRIDSIYGNIPPAYSALLLQGPHVDGEENDIALFDGQHLAGKKNLPMTRFYPFIEGDPIFTDPDFEDYTSSLLYYNAFRALSSYGWISIPSFPLSGNPDANTGRVDGEPFPQSDRKMMMISGPFDLLPGQSQAVVIAELVAGNISTVSNTYAVKLAKFYANQINYRWMVTGIDDEVEISEFSLRQNYPNPFNPVTNIEFQLPKSSFVKLEVFDLLGRKVSSLVNKELSSGLHKIKFDGSGLPSGIYFYLLKTKYFSGNKKMILVK